MERVFFSDRIRPERALLSHNHILCLLYLVPFDRLYYCKIKFAFPGHVLIDEGVVSGYEAGTGSLEIPLYL